MNTSEGHAALELDDVKRHFGGIKAADGVTLDVEEGAVVALIGPNGAGKSTLFALMMGELVPTSGTIRLDGRDLKGLSPEQHSRLGMGRTFQTPRLFAGLTVEENAQIALLARNGAERGRRVPGEKALGEEAQIAGAPVAQAQVTKALVAQALVAQAPVEEALGEVGLLDARGRPASALSQGQRKRLELAMVLALRPRILLLDEPTAGMGVEERATIMALVMGAVRRRGLTLVFCEHDMETVFAHALRVVVMDRGRILTDGSPEQVRRDPQVQEIYLGTPEAQ